jgi:hypothetical protein
MTSLVENAIAREVLAAPDGKSGNVVERVTLADGRALVVKRLIRGGDWLARATQDDGRIAILWDSGYLDRMPPAVNHAVVSVETEADGWLVVMEDVSRSLIPDQTVVSRGAHRRVMAAINAMAEEFWGEHTEGLCSLETRYAFLSPATAAREAGGRNPVPELIGRGWEVFAEVVPADVADAVMTILERPELLAAELSRSEGSLIHGDLKFGNLGFKDERVVMIDWGDRAGFAPPAVELALYLAINATRLDATHDELVADFEAEMGERCDASSLELALLGGLVQLGWDKALAVTERDPGAMAREREDLDWWVARARAGLEEWSPV